MESRFTFNPYKVILIVTLIAVSILIIPSISSVKFAAAYDEGYYLRYAQYIAENGISGFRDLFEEYSANKENWLFPSPLRIGFIVMSSIAIKLFGNSFIALAYLSFFSYLLFIIVMFFFCKRFYDQGRATLLTLLVAFSPIHMAMSRRALIDSFITLFLGLSLWLFLDLVLSKEKSFSKKVLFVIVLTLTIIIKESSVLLLGPFIIYMIIYKIRHKEGFKVTEVLPYVLVYPVALACFVYLLLSGSISHVIHIAKIIIFISPKINPFALQYCSGPWFTYLIDYTLLSPWTLLLCVGYLFTVLQNFPESDLKDVYFVTIIIALLLLLSLFTKSVRYFMILDVAIRLFSILMLYKLIPVKSASTRNIVVGVIVVIICINDFHTFYDMFIRRNLYDPTSYWLLKLRHIIPYR